jgi:hypothetical protein
MKKLIIIFLVFVIVSCKKDTLELTGMEGKLVNQKGEVQKSFKIYYSIYEFVPNGFGGGGREIRDPVEVVSDNDGNFIISEILKYRQYLEFKINLIYATPLIDTFYVKSNDYYKYGGMEKGKYYKDVVIVVKK